MRTPLKNKYGQAIETEPRGLLFLAWTLSRVVAGKQGQSRLNGLDLMQDDDPDF